MYIKIHSWKGVATWNWNVPNEKVCGICRFKYESSCPECKRPGDDCPLIWGECSHVFHMHCLIKWISQDSSKQLCPMDRQPWRTKT